MSAFDLFNRCAAEADRRITETLLVPQETERPRLGYAAALAHLHVAKQQALRDWAEFMRPHMLPPCRPLRKRVRLLQWRVKLRRAGAKRRAR